MALYSTNVHMLREFALQMEQLYFFPMTAKKSHKTVLNRKDFVKRVEDSNFIIFRPNEMRKKYTEFVLFNKPRALLPSRKSLRDSPRHPSLIKMKSFHESAIKHNGSMLVDE